MTNRPNEEEVLAYFSSLSNWGRWGHLDQRGTLNLISEDTVRASLKLARVGRVIACGRTIAPGSVGAGSPLHFMVSSGESAPASGFGGATDWIGLAFHGRTVTHLDAPSHIFWDGKMFNGHDASQVTTARGARVGSVEMAGEGVIARGVLADIARHRGVRSLSGESAVMVDELEACLRAQGVAVGAGDALLVRTGHGPATAAPTIPGYPGLQASCLPWLRQNDVALLVSDVAQEVEPSGYARLPFPIHAVGIVAMGMWLLDNADLELLAAACAELGVWEFLFTVAPIRLKNSTGAPVNPIAIL